MSRGSFFAATPCSATAPRSFREERHLREALIQEFGYPSRPDEPARHLPSPETVALIAELLGQLDAAPVPQR